LPKGSTDVQFGIVNERFEDPAMAHLRDHLGGDMEAIGQEKRLGFLGLASRTIGLEVAVGNHEDRTRQELLAAPGTRYLPDGGIVPDTSLPDHGVDLLQGQGQDQPHHKEHA
jgi:hypothetical protein